MGSHPARNRAYDSNIRLGMPIPIPMPRDLPPHNPTVPVGLALFQGGDSNRARAFYSETRFNRLLTARGPMLHTLLARTFRMLGSGQSFNWRQMARLILHEGYREDSAEYVRHQIARAYYQAERRSAQQSKE